VQEVTLAEELEHSLHPTDRWEISVELDKASTHVDKIDGERATEGKQLSQWTMRISNVLVDLGLLAI
jgi:hypothetical protein